MARVTVLILVLISAGCSANFPDIPNPRGNIARDTVDHRLPTNTIPHAYDIIIEPTFEPDFTFNGKVTIEIEVIEDTDQITLHGNAIEIDHDSVIVREPNEVNPNLALAADPITENPDLHFIHINLEEQVVAGTILEIYIEYTGVLNEERTGFYRASYVEDGEPPIWFGTTQMEPTYARQAFPCYDEPALKANFTIHIIREEKYHSISNMKWISEDIVGDKFQDNFETSVEMSTYLVAFVVSELGVEENEAENQAVYGVPELIDEGRGVYGLQMGIDLLNTLEEYTGVDYSLDKLDQVSIPDDWFSAGAMENWGLVTYRDRYLLWKEGVSTATEKQNVATIIAHELAHQWFGNLVSPLWWDHLWLNEGFATYFEYYATALVETDMRLAEQFVVDSHQNAMDFDALTSTRPMTFDAQSPEAISNLFDRVAYDKSGAVIRMMQHFLTTEVFQKGLNVYLNNMQFKAAVAQDLWDGLQTAILDTDPESDMNVTEIMDTWSSQAGFPLVRVSRVDGQIVLSQSRFLLLDANDRTDVLWTIPINYATSSDADFTDTTATHWLKLAEEETDITVEDGEWIIINKQSAGFYRVQYEDENWNLIIDQLKSENFEDVHVLNRAQLVDDALNLARSGRLHYNITMNLLTYLSRETDYIPLASFFRGLSFLNRHLVNSQHYDNFRRFVRDILETAYDNLQDGADAHADILNRNNVFTWLCRYDHEACVAAMHEATSTLAETPPDMQSLVYCGGLIEDTDINSKWDQLYERYSGNDAEYLEKNRIVSALGCTRSEELLDRLLNMIVDQDDDYSLSDGHRGTAFTGIVSSSQLGLNISLSYIIENFDTIRTKENVPITSIISGLASRLTTSEQKSLFQEFTSGLSNEIQATYEEAFTNALSTINANIAWSERYVDDIGDWLEDYYGNAYVFGVSIPLLIIALISHIFT